MSASGRDADVIRRGVLLLRHRYLQAETVLDFYGDAINTRAYPVVMLVVHAPRGRPGHRDQPPLGVSNSYGVSAGRPERC